MNCKQCREVGKHCLEPTSLSSTCSSAVLITGSCFFCFFFLSLFSGTQEGGEDGLCMDPGVCCVPGYDTWVCSGLLELCCGFFQLACLNSSGFGTALENCVDFLFCCCSVAQFYIYDVLVLMLILCEQG